MMYMKHSIYSNVQDQPLEAGYLPPQAQVHCLHALPWPVTLCDIMPFVIFEVLWKIPRALLYWEISEF